MVPKRAMHHICLRLSRSFVWIDLLSSEIWNEFTDHIMGFCVTEPGFLGENLLWEKWPNMVGNGPQNRVFGRFKKIRSLILSENSVKWKCLWSFKTLQKRLSCKILVIVQNCSWPTRLGYLLIVNILWMDWCLALIFFYVVRRN